LYNSSLLTKLPLEASERAAAIECRNALFITDPFVDRESLITTKGDRVQGTCEWITQDANYLVWLNGGGNGDGGSTHDRRLLWISGGPGKGKTMLSIFLTEELEKHVVRRDAAELIFFFCSAQDEKRNTAVAVLRGLLYQIIDKRPQLAKHALPYFESAERKQHTISSLEALWIIFSKLVADTGLGRMFCVLDGLDECEESTRRPLLSRLVSLLNEQTLSSPSTFKLAIISRDIPGLHACPRIRLDPDNDENVVGDIERFVSERVNDLSTIEGFDENLRESVQRELLARAEGTFLWVGFAVQELSQKHTCSEILEALQSLPKGLPAIYSRMLLQIPEEQRETSRMILRWIALAVRPLQLNELAAAIGIQSSFPTRLTEEQATRDAIFYCKPLLQEQKMNTIKSDVRRLEWYLFPEGIEWIKFRQFRQDQEDKEISFMHQSVRDYFLRKERDNNIILEKFRIEPESENHELAKTCLDCIAKSGLQYGPLYYKSLYSPQESSLLPYAVCHWPEHAKSRSARGITLVDTFERFFNEDSIVQRNWWLTYRDAKLLPNLPSIMPRLHILCYLGLLPLVEAAVAKRRWELGYSKRLNRRDRDGDTALHLAIRAHNLEVVRVLIDKGAKINVGNNGNFMPLHSAAYLGDTQMVCFLLDKGADINSNSDDGNTALHYAAWAKDKAVLRLLLDKGANTNAKNIHGNTALHHAANGGNEAVVRLLLDRGADINAKNIDGETVLHEAIRCFDCYPEMEAIVQLLLRIQIGIDITARRRDGKTALDMAMKQNNMTAVELLEKAER
jgi:ankyrin repeat protein